jgi:hypothetical protein
MPPFIPYPDVPNVPGVPPLPQPPIGYTFPVDDVNTEDLDQGDTVALDTTPTWTITDDDGNPVLQPDSVIEFEYRGEMKVCSHPVEQGSFASYNKIAVPFDIRMTAACNGNGPMTRDDFLATIEDMRESTDLVTISTPDDVYDNCNLIHVDYRRDSRQGVSLLLVQLWFQEIRIAQQGQTQTAQPDGMDPSQNGQVSPINPTANQSAAYDNAPIDFGNGADDWSD